MFAAAAAVLARWRAAGQVGREYVTRQRETRAATPHCRCVGGTGREGQAGRGGMGSAKGGWGTGRGRDLGWD